MKIQFKAFDTVYSIQFVKAEHANNFAKILNDVGIQVIENNNMEVAKIEKSLDPAKPVEKKSYRYQRLPDTFWTTPVSLYSKKVYVFFFEGKEKKYMEAANPQAAMEAVNEKTKAGIGAYASAYIPRWRQQGVFYVGDAGEPAKVYMRMKQYQVDAIKTARDSLFGSANQTNVPQKIENVEKKGTDNGKYQVCECKIIRSIDGERIEYASDKEYTFVCADNNASVGNIGNAECRDENMLPYLVKVQIISITEKTVPDIREIAKSKGYNKLGRVHVIKEEE